MKIRQRYYIKKGDIRDLQDQLVTSFGEAAASKILPKKARVERIMLDEGDNLIAINGELTLWKHEEEFIPVLTTLLRESSLLKPIVVDMGAIRFVTNGADIMRPGVVEFDPTIKKDEIVKIVDVTHHKPLAVGRALDDSDVLKKMTKGKVALNIHTASDNLWKFIREFSGS